MRYKDADTPLPDIARELNVDALVEGAVLHTGDQIRITVFLFDANNTRLWNGEYEQSTGDVLTLQSQLARAIAAEVHAKVSPEEASRLAAARAVDPEAFRAYLLGRRAWNLRTQDGFNQAIAHFNEAVEKDPSYAQAHAGLADSYTLLGVYGHLPPKQALPIAKGHADKALTIDDTLAEAYTSRGQARMAHDWEWSQAERDYQRAIELSPGYAIAHLGYAHLLNCLARHAEAIASIKRAQELDPLSPIINASVGWAFFFAGRHDEAIEAYRKVLEMNPKFAVAHAFLGDSYIQKAMFPMAIAAYRKAVSLSQRQPSYVGRLGYGYAAWGKTDEATRILDELKEQRKRRYVSATRLAKIHAALGETDQAFDWLAWLKVQPAFAPLRSDPRFIDLLRRVGLDRAAPEARGTEPQ